MNPIFIVLLAVVVVIVVAVLMRRNSLPYRHPAAAAKRLRDILDREAGEQQAALALAAFKYKLSFVPKTSADVEKVVIGSSEDDHKVRSIIAMLLGTIYLKEALIAITDLVLAVNDSDTKFAKVNSLATAAIARYEDSILGEANILSLMREVVEATDNNRNLSAIKKDEILFNASRKLVDNITSIGNHIAPKTA